MVNIATKDWCNTYCEQWEYSKDRLCRLTHITHVAVSNKEEYRKEEHKILQSLILHEVEHECSSCYNEHNNVLNDCHT